LWTTNYSASVWWLDKGFITKRMISYSMTESSCMTCSLVILRIGHFYRVPDHLLPIWAIRRIHTFTHTHMSIEECILLRYILAVPPGHQFQLQPDINWDATSNTLTPLPLQWSISFSTALFMISLTENQRSEPITIYRMGFYLPSVKGVCIWLCFAKERSDVWLWYLTYTQRKKNLEWHCGPANYQWKGYQYQINF